MSGKFYMATGISIYCSYLLFRVFGYISWGDPQFVFLGIMVLMLAIMERRRLRKFDAFPSWLLVNSTTLFLPTKHEWAGRFFALGDWHKHRSNITRTVDAIMWMYVMGLAVFLYFKFF